MAKFTAISAVLYLVGLLINLTTQQSVFGILEGAGLVGLLASAVHYTVRSFRKLRRKLLWKVRNKILVSFAFVGMIPILILALIGLFTFRMLFGPVGATYLDNEIQAISAALRDTNRRLQLEFYASGERTPERLKAMLRTKRQFFARSHPGLDRLRSILFLSEGEQGSFRPAGVAADEGQPHLTLPEWVEPGFWGLVHENEKLFFRSLERIDLAQGAAIVALQLPFDGQVVRYIEDRTPIRLTPPRSVEVESRNERGSNRLFQGQGGLLTINWFHFVSLADWSSGSTMAVLDDELRRFALSVPLTELYFSSYFSQETGLVSTLVRLIIVLGIVFIAVEAASLFVGFAIARSITRSVQSLSAGTQRILAGEFGYQIPSGRSDQLDALAGAFNQMSESIVGLLGQVSEKERLEQELQIAREVQNQLFPQVVPQVSRLQLAGQCLPARTVSGDYYDFIPYGGQQLDIVVADISGKGISAALLMASLQSAIRSHVVHQASLRAKDQPGIAVAAINRHLYAQTAADKFATMVFSCFDAEQLQLTYCNAGHNPPLLFTNGDVRKLGTGGMVAGLFEEREYEEETLQLRSGDIVVFYTDGVVEAEDPQGEQFGEERLISLVGSDRFLTADDIQKLILDEVATYSQGGDQRDDITVVVLKID